MSEMAMQVIKDLPPPACFMRRQGETDGEIELLPLEVRVNSPEDSGTTFGAPLSPFSSEYGSSTGERMQALVDSLSELEPVLKEGPRWKLNVYLDAMDRLREARSYLLDKAGSEGELKVLEDLEGMGMENLQKEFVEVLSLHSKPLKGKMLRELASTIAPEDAVAAITMGDIKSAELQEALKDWLMSSMAPFLHQMAQRLVDGGDSEFCIVEYRRARAMLLQESICSMGMVPLTATALEDVPWKDLENTMADWIKDLHTLVHVLLLGEQKMIEQVFGDLGIDNEKLLGAIATDSGMEAAFRLLVRNARAISDCQRIPEKLFGLLLMHNSCQEVNDEVLHLAASLPKDKVEEEWRELPSVLGRAACASIDTLKKRLSFFEPQDNISKMAQFLPKVFRKNSKERIQRVDPKHAVASYVMNYVSLFCSRNSLRYAEGLEQVLAHVYGAWSVHEEALDVVDMLIKNLHARALEYKDPPLQHLFLLNNFHYIQRRLIMAHITDALRVTDLIREEVDQFEKAVLQQILAPLGDIDESASLDESAVQTRLKKFNIAFEEVALQQRLWIISDDEIRRRLRARVAKGLGQWYGKFLLPYCNFLSKVPSYRYRPDGLEKLVTKSFFSSRSQNLNPATSSLSGGGSGLGESIFRSSTDTHSSSEDIPSHGEEWIVVKEVPLKS